MMMRLIARRTVLIQSLPVLFCTLFLANPTSPGATPQDRLEAIINNVKSTEALFRNLEVIRRRVYRFNDSANLETAPGLDRNMEFTSRSVLQGDYIYCKNSQRATTFANEEATAESIEGFDGNITRSLDGDKLVNLYHGRHERCELFRPHTWLLQCAFMCFPMSAWLRGGDELQRHSSKVYADWYQRVELVKEDVVDGLNCFQIRTEIYDGNAKGALNSRRLTWLAPERNYLPVKTEGYIPRWSNTIPIEAGKAEDFREVSPGIWLPHHYQLTVYDGPAA